jgi:YVTN family beta-propeller protein
MQRSAIVPVGACVVACATASPRPRPLEGLRDEGELHVYVEALDGESQRLSLVVASLTAHGQGREVPLVLALGTIAGAELRHQRLLASGRLPPGRYDGLRLAVSKAAVRTARGVASILVPKEAPTVEVPFTIESKRATVVWLSLKYPRSQDDDYSFPALSAHVAPVPAPDLIGYCPNTGGANVTLFDKLGRKVAAVLPTRSAPTGIALDPAQNRVYVALELDDAIDVLDATSGDPIARIALRTGDDPRRIALVRGGSLLLVLNERSNTLSFVDVATSAEEVRIRTGEQPWSLTVDRSEARAYVFNRVSNSVTAVDLSTRLPVATVTTEPEPLWGAIDFRGTRLYVVHRGSLYMTVYALPQLTLERRVFVGAPASFVKVDPRTDLVYVALGDEPRVQVYDPLSFLPLNAVATAAPVTYMVIDDVENAMFLLMPRRRSIAVLNLTSRKTLGALDVGLDPHELTLAGKRD